MLTNGHGPYLFYHISQIFAIYFFVFVCDVRFLLRVAQGLAFADGDLLLVTGEGVVHQLLFGLGGEQGHHRDNNQPGDHAESAAVDGGDQKSGEAGLQGGDIGQHDHGGEDKAGPAGGSGGAPPVQAVEEGGQESSGQGAPADAHELGDEGDAGAVLDDGQHHGDGDKHHDQAAHDEHLLFLVHLFYHMALEQVQGEGGAGGEHQGAEGGHGGGQHQDHHHRQQQVGQAGEHGGDDRVEAAHGSALVGDAHHAGEQPAEAAQKVAAARHYNGEEGGDHRAGVDGLLALDGVEFLHHLGQAPGAQGGEDDHAQQIHRVGTEEGGEHAGGGGRLSGHLGQLGQGRHKAALAVQHRHDDGGDAEKHDDALDKVVDGGGHVAPGDDVDAGEDGHDDDADGVVDVKGHAEQTGQTVVQAGGVGDQEDEDNHRGGDLQRLGAKPPAEKLGHGGAVQMLGHDPGAAAQHHPGQQGAKHRVADARPGGGDAVLPAKLSGVAHKDHGGEIGGAVGKGGEPGTHGAPAQHEAVDVGGVLTAVQANAHHNPEEHQQHNNFDCHRKQSSRPARFDALYR